MWEWGVRGLVPLQLADFLALKPQKDFTKQSKHFKQLLISYSKQVKCFIKQV